jgi:hypothetical protein
VERYQQVEVDEKEPERENRRYVSEGKGLQEAGEDLCRFIDEHRLSDSKKGPRRPLVILAFDEADTLTDNPPDKKKTGTCSPSCVVFYDKSNIFKSFRCSFRQQDASINSPQMYILILQPGPENPSSVTSVPWIRFRKSASTTLRTQHRRILSQ